MEEQKPPGPEYRPTPFAPLKCHRCGGTLVQIGQPPFPQKLICSKGCPGAYTLRKAKAAPPPAPPPGELEGVISMVRVILGPVDLEQTPVGDLTGRWVLVRLGTGIVWGPVKDCNDITFRLAVGDALINRHRRKHLIGALLKGVMPPDVFHKFPDGFWQARAGLPTEEQELNTLAEIEKSEGLEPMPCAETEFVPPQRKEGKEDADNQPELPPGGDTPKDSA